MSKLTRGILPLFVFCGLLAAAEAPPFERGSVEPLERAWEFASAIMRDPVDKGTAQEAVVQDLLAAGYLEEAAGRARQMDGWRRATALADLAAREARRGRLPEARVVLAEARGAQVNVTGWQRQRVAMHIAGAEAALGETDAALTAAAALAKEDNQYSGQPAAIVAPLLAERGQLDRALHELGLLDGAPDLDATLARTRGYLDVARVESIGTAARLDVLRRAGTSARGVPGWLKVDGLTQVALLQGELGDRAAARATLEAARPTLDTLPLTLPRRPMLLAQAAEAWSAAGNPKAAQRLLRDAEAGVPSNLIIDQPAGYASIARAHARLLASPEAARLFDRSLDAAAALVNARPRALALVEITREMSRASWPVDDAARRRLTSLRDGLKDPW